MGNSPDRKSLNQSKRVPEQQALCVFESSPGYQVEIRKISARGGSATEIQGVNVRKKQTRAERDQIRIGHRGAEEGRRSEEDSKSGSKR